MTKLSVNILFVFLFISAAPVLTDFFSAEIQEEQTATAPFFLLKAKTEKYSRKDTIMKYTFLWEGGYQKMPIDKGNYSTSGVLCGTKYGISAIAYEDYFGLVSQSDMKNLKKEIANEIYYEKYYKPLQLSKIKNNAVAHIIFDTYIAQPVNCRRILSKVLKQKVKTPLTDEIILAINTQDQNVLFAEIWNLRHNGILKRSAKYPEFKAGWVSRINKLKALWNQ